MKTFLRNFPISFFSKVLGLLGFALVVKKGIHVLGFPTWFGAIASCLAIVIFAVVAGMYAAKCITFPKVVLEEFFHPIKMNFFPLVSICLLLTSVLIAFSLQLSFYFWAVGTFLHLSFTFLLVSMWLYHPHFDINHMNPSWFIPCVGTILIPLMGVEFGFTEVSWFAFSVGFFSWLMLFTIVFYRLIFHHPLIDKLLPTTFILMAPPAVATMSYAKLVSLQEIDSVSRMFYYFSLFLMVLLLLQARRFWKSQFYLSWWASSFPMSDVISATLLIFEKTHNPFLFYLAYILFGFLTVLVAWLFYRTIKGLWNRDFKAVLMTDD